MNPDILLLLDIVPGILLLYVKFGKCMSMDFPDAIIKIKAKQVIFYNTYAFASLDLGKNKMESDLSQSTHYHRLTVSYR